jgi:hypothetical protein
MYALFSIKLFLIMIYSTLFKYFENISGLAQVIHKTKIMGLLIYVKFAYLILACTVAKSLLF